MPSLTILAGPNGAGKTRNTDFLLSENLLTALPIDLDLLVVQAHDDLSHSFYGADERLLKSVDRLFLNYCREAINSNVDFSYECNFRKDQLKYVGLFEEAGYSLNLIFCVLCSVEQSMKRVNYRANYEKGRNVDIKSIQENFKQGLDNLDNHYQDFHRVLIVDSSQDDYKNSGHPLNLQLDIQGDKVSCYNPNFPSDKLKPYLPKITSLIQQNLKNNQ